MPNDVRVRLLRHEVRARHLTATRAGPPTSGASPVLEDAPWLEVISAMVGDG